MTDVVFITGAIPDSQEPGGQQPAVEEPLDAYSRVVVSVAAQLTPSVASLRVSRRVRGWQILDGAGSGVVITSDGFVLTSAHVVSGSDSRGARVVL